MPGDDQHDSGHGTRSRMPCLLLLAIILPSLVALLVVGVSATAATIGLGVSGPVYTVAALEQGIARAPGTWLGRTILVRARIGACSATGVAPTAPCADGQPALVDLGAEAIEAPLTLAQDGPDQRLALLRALPGLGRLAPAPQRLHWEGNTTYRVRLRSVPCHRPEDRGCYFAVLLDAEPWDKVPMYPKHGVDRNVLRPTHS